jgi:hypothetical protein
MRLFLQAATLIVSLVLAIPSFAATPGPACRAACAPRIERDCGAPGVKGFGKCKKKLVRACRRSTPETACALQTILGGSSGGGGGGGGTTGGNGGLAATVTAALADKLVSHGTDQFFSSGSIVETDDMTLCGSGSVHLIVTTITTTTLDDFSSTDTFDGTWTVSVAGGVATLELNVGEAQPRRFAVAVDAAGNVVIDGRTADVSDASVPCGAGGPNGGGTTGGGTTGGDLAQEATQLLTDHAVFFEEDNIGFGHRVTAMVLCASGRYALEIDASVFPGVEVSTSGDWSVVLDGGAPVLRLAGTGAQPTRDFALANDAAGNLTMNGANVQVGNADLVGQVCPTL